MGAPAHDRKVQAFTVGLGASPLRTRGCVRVTGPHRSCQHLGSFPSPPLAAEPVPRSLAAGGEAWGRSQPVNQRSAMAADLASAWVLAVLAALTLQPAGLANSLLPTRSSPPALLADRGCTRLLTQHTAPSSLQRTLFCTVLAHGMHVAALVHDSTFRHDHVGLCSAPMAMPRRRGGTHLHCIVCLCWPAA